jgi:hypothetical protein
VEDIGKKDGRGINIVVYYTMRKNDMVFSNQTSDWSLQSYSHRSVVQINLVGQSIYIIRDGRGGQKRECW